MTRASNPYGDGRAAKRAVAAMAHLLGLGDAPEEFRP
jgi:UDP-N-acetylglucosamine 2-epimerase (non-hydrolysing)